MEPIPNGLVIINKSIPDSDTSPPKEKDTIRVLLDYQIFVLQPTEEGGTSLTYAHSVQFHLFVSSDFELRLLIFF